MKTCTQCDKDYENKKVARRYIFEYAVMCEDCYNKALMKSAKKVEPQGGNKCTN